MDAPIKLFGALVGGSILIVFMPILVVTIILCIITMVVVCIFNKHCPLYSLRQRRRRQPQIGVLVMADCQQDDNAKDNTLQGII